MMNKFTKMALAIATIAMIAAALIPPRAVLADWSAPTANLAAYEELYAREIQDYKRVRYGMESADVQRIKQQLRDLGFFDNRINTSYFRTLEIAARVFCQQTRIGGDGREITPLMQAMLADPAAQRAVSPGINIYTYSSTRDETKFLAFTYAQLQRPNTQREASVGVKGKVAGVNNEGSVQYISMVMEDRADRIIYIVYQPLPRTTRFQAGDAVAVFGVTQGPQSLPYDGMREERLVIQADRVGYQ
ncbi:MAG: hypothetical protein LBS11_02340 [Oscillospiraceae bacterium]|jgi:hypothetical protein|nr:hypothetical protein [Oscillospiraceae bacterium]